MADRHEQDPVNGHAFNQQRSEWVQPIVTTFQAGDAEGGDFANPDGNVAS